MAVLTAPAPERAPQPVEPTRRSSDRSRALVAVLAILVVAGVVLRLWALLTPLGHADSDEAVVSLMARSFLDGHVTTYYWGQNYGGTIEPLLVALVYAIAGPSTWALKLVPMVLSAAACVVLWRVGRRTIGEPAARFAAALFWVFPPAFLLGSMKERGFYQAALLLVLLTTLYALRVAEAAKDTDRRLPRFDLVALGLCAGLAVWTTPQSAYVLAPIAGWLCVVARQRWREAWPAVPAAIVGALPFLAYAATHGKSAFYQNEVASTYPSRLRNFFTDMIGRAFGGKIPYSPDWLGGALGRVAFLVGLTVFVVLLVMHLRDPERRRKVFPLLVAVVAYPVLVTVPRVSTFTTEARYVLLLAPFVVLLLSYVITRTSARVVVGVGAVVLAGTFLASTLAWVADHPQNEDVGPVTTMPLEVLLEQLDVDHVYADYWIAYRLMHDSDERIVASPVTGVRNDAIAAAVADAPPAPYVVFADDVYDRELALALQVLGVGYQRVAGAEYAVYLPERSVDPARFDAIWARSP